MAAPFDTLVEKYGDLLFDLCESVLWSAINARIALRKILRRIQKEAQREHYQEFQRPWILRICYEELMEFARHHGRRLSPPEQIMLDSGIPTGQRLKHFDSYLHRLSHEDLFLILLKEKYQIPLLEIASSMGISAETLKLKRIQALRSMEDWIWGEA